jgi:hypothetical protein
MKYILIGAVVLLVVADFVFWGGPRELAQHIHDAIGNTASATTQAVGSIGGMISGTNQGVGNAFKSGLGH